MSLIHEALQKAEAERRAGELPPLLSVTGPTESRAPTRAPLWLLAPLVLVAAAVAYSNRALIRDTLTGSDADEPKPANTAMAPTSPAAVDRNASANRESEPAPARPMVVPTSDVGAAAAPADPVAQNPVQKPRPQEEPPVSEHAPSPSEPAQIPVPIVAETPAAPLADAVAAVDPTPEQTAPAAGAPDSFEPEATAPSEPDASASIAPDASAVPAASALPYVFELPLGTRQALPALKVTMHVYNVDPGRRFAIIDGKRVNEGGILGNDLNVIEIQRDAILIEFRGTRFLLPRIGR